jgi:HSP20 family protein
MGGLMVSVTRYRDAPVGLVGLQRLNRLLDEAFAGWPAAEEGNVVTSSWFAPTDICEDADSLQIRMEVPGVKPEDVKISLEDNILTIHGEKRQQSENSAERVHRYERSYGTFERTFALPNNVDAEKISARYENGILTVMVPKSERARPREIPVNAGNVGSRQAQVSSVGTRSSASPPPKGTHTEATAARGSSRDRDPEEEGSAGKTAS